MKAPPFDYVKPSALTEVYTLLQDYGDDARLLAGGQTLVATLNMRLSEPRLLIDLCGIEGISGIHEYDSHIAIGAMTRHRDIEDSPLIARHLPMLTMAAPHVGHRAIRNRGTLGGSIAFADPSAEWPACCVALDAVFVLGNQQGERRVPARDFFLDLYTTALEPDEVLLSCEFPIHRDEPMRHSFHELSRRHGDYAIVGLAAAARVSDGVFHELSLAFLGAGNTPVLADKAAALLRGQPLQPELLEQARAALAVDLDPAADLYTASRTKMYLAGVLLGRALKQLAEH